MLFDFSNAFSNEQLAGWFSVIPYRYSCRRFDLSLDEDSLRTLQSKAESIQINGVRGSFLINTKGNNVFINIPFLSKFQDVEHYVALIVDKNYKNSKFLAGIWGEALVLEAARLNIQSCWIGGTFKKGLVKTVLDPEEEIVALVALGKSSKSSHFKRKRKQLRALCSSDPFTWDAHWASVVAEAVRSSPSALNLQPWSFSCEAETMAIKLKSLNSLDSGIAILHALCALKDGQYTWDYNSITHQFFIKEA